LQAANFILYIVIFFVVASGYDCAPQSNWLKLNFLAFKQTSKFKPILNKFQNTGELNRNIFCIQLIIVLTR